LTRCTWRKIQDLGLTRLYKEDETFKQFCGQIDALAFLPIGLVRAGLQFLKSICPLRAMELLEYFDKNYINGKYKRRPNGTIIRVPAKFPSKWWNVHDATISDNPRTNHHCEG
jgi:hypothetical protein